jgi:hypothetical protein
MEKNKISNKNKTYPNLNNFLLILFIILYTLDKTNVLVFDNFLNLLKKLINSVF